MSREAKESKLREIVTRRIALFQKKPESARYNPKVTSRHISGLHTENSVREHTVVSDYAEPAGGSNKAPNPIELLLSAVASCIEAAFYEFAAHEGLKIDDISMEVTGELDLRGLFMVDETVRPGFEELIYRMDIKSPEEPEKVRALAKKVIAHCPVVDSLIRPVSVKGEITCENS